MAELTMDRPQSAAPNPASANAHGRITQVIGAVVTCSSTATYPRS
jgi:hypothetical protein